MINFTTIARLLSFLGVSKSRILFEYAKLQVGKEKVGIPDTAPRDVNCVEALNQIYMECFDYPICGGASTVTLFMKLKTSKQYKKVDISEALPGDIIVSPTDGPRHGHCGIVGEAERIYSNNSFTGLWGDTYRFSTWRQFYESKLGLQTYFFRVLN